MRRVTLWLALSCGLSATAAAQSWHQLLLSPRTQHAMAFDSARQRVVLFGGFVFDDPGATWLYDGSRWRALQPTSGPPMRRDHVMAYDSTRQRVVAYGGMAMTGTIQWLHDTWEFDGTNWNQVPTANAPIACDGAAMVYDRARQRMVLFGGFDHYVSPRAETWHYDGTDWTLAPTASAPPARAQHAMAYDALRQRCVVFGGRSGLDPLGDTWEFDGAAWQQITTPNQPAARTDAGLAFDQRRGRCVLFGGNSPGGPRAVLQDTWEYDGSTWQQRSPTGSPAGRFLHAMAFDDARGATVLFGGNDGYDFADTWEYDGSAWRQTASETLPPRVQWAGAFDAARRRVLLFGGRYNTPLDDSWEFRDATWRQLRPATSPPAREGAALAYDAARDRAVLFGGVGADLQFRNDTWEFDGVDWSAVASTPAPPVRASPSLTWDAGRGRLVLFGGSGDASSFNFRNDTWEFDGRTWTNVPTAHAPSIRCDHAAVYDASRGRIVLFGGRAHLIWFGDTWEFDGSDWMQVATAHAPAARFAAAFAYDVGRGRCLLFSGEQRPADLWQYDGSDWSQVAAQHMPGSRSAGLLVHDAADGSCLLVGGSTVWFGPILGDVWRFEPPATPSWTRHGRGCAGSGGVPGLDLPASSVPALGANLPLQFTNLPPAPGLLWLAFGFDPVQWRGAALPIGGFGLAPGCMLWIVPELGIALPHPGGSAGLVLRVPADPALAGLRLCLQALVLDASLPSGIGTVTNAGIARLY